MSDAVSPPSSSPPSFPLLSLPSSLLLLLSDSFLTDCESRSFVLSCKAALNHLRAYKIKREMPLEMAEDVSHRWFLPKSNGSSSSSSSTQMTMSIHPHRWRIGSPVNVKVENADRLERLANLLACVRTVRFAHSSPMHSFLTFPPFVTEIRFESCSQLPLSLKGMKLPETLKKLVLLHTPSHHPFPSSPSFLPSSLLSLTLSPSCTQPTDVLIFPASLTELDIPMIMTEGGGSGEEEKTASASAITNTYHISTRTSHTQVVRRLNLPSSLVKLTLSQSKQGVQITSLLFPPTLTSLTFGAGQLFNFLPALLVSESMPNLTNLVMGSDFNREVKNWILPSSLLSLSFHSPPPSLCSFNQSLNGWVLPSGLLDLDLGPVFNQPVEGWRLPASLRSLKLGENFAQSLLPLTFPSSLSSLSLGKLPARIQGWRCPHGVREMKWERVEGRLEDVELPEGLETLDVPLFNSPSPLSALRLPPNLKEYICTKAQGSVEGVKLPSGLIRAKFGAGVTKVCSLILPSSLLYLTFHSRIFTLSSLVLPSTLTSLEFNGGCAVAWTELNGKWPKTLTHLTLASGAISPYNTLPSLLLPPTLTSLCVDSGDLRALNEVWEVPKQVRRLKLGRERHEGWQFPLSKIRFNSGLQSLICVPWRIKSAVEESEKKYWPRLPKSLREITLTWYHVQKENQVWQNLMPIGCCLKVQPLSEEENW
jgi:hypothetical protein